MIIMRHEPFSAVEDPDFRAYQRVLNKKALIYTRRSFKDLLRLRTLRKRAKLLEFFVIQASGQDMLHTPSAIAKLPRYAAVTSDSWTSAKKETYTSLSLHVVGSSVHELFSFPFDIEKVDGHTYGVNIVRNPSSVTNYTNSIYEQFYCRTYCTVNKTRYTVDSGEKEKGKTIVS